jgi:translation initiation factor IF-1
MAKVNPGDVVKLETSDVRDSFASVYMTTTPVQPTAGALLSSPLLPSAVLY